jgi:hypothetical protein
VPRSRAAPEGCGAGAARCRPAHASTPKPGSQPFRLTCTHEPPSTQHAGAHGRARDPSRARSRPDPQRLPGGVDGGGPAAGGGGGGPAAAAAAGGGPATAAAAAAVAAGAGSPAAAALSSGPAAAALGGGPAAGAAALQAVAPRDGPPPPPPPPQTAAVEAARSAHAWRLGLAPGVSVRLVGPPGAPGAEPPLLAQAEAARLPWGDDLGPLAAGFERSAGRFTVACRLAAAPPRGSPLAGLPAGHTVFVAAAAPVLQPPRPPVKAVVAASPHASTGHTPAAKKGGGGGGSGGGGGGSGGGNGGGGAGGERSRAVRRLEV